MEAADRIITALGALAQPHRLATFRSLVAAGPAGLPAGEIAAQLGIAPSSLSFHLAQLEHAELAQRRRSGRSIIYSANFGTMNDLIAYLTENCCNGGDCTPLAKDAA